MEQTHIPAIMGLRSVAVGFLIIDDALLVVSTGRRIVLLLFVRGLLFLLLLVVVPCEAKLKEEKSSSMVHATGIITCMNVQQFRGAGKHSGVQNGRPKKGNLSHDWWLGHHFRRRYVWTTVLP